MRANWYDIRTIPVDVKAKRIEGKDIELDTMESLDIEFKKKDIRRKPYGKSIMEKNDPDKVFYYGAIH